MSRLREPGLESLRQFIEAHCHGLDAAEAIRAAADAVQVGLGQTMLRRLTRTRAYHQRTGPLEDGELLTAGAVIRLIREVTGMGDEPGHPVERETRRWPPNRDR